MFSRLKVAMVLAEFFGAGVLTLVLLSVGKSGVGYSYFLASGVALAAIALALLLENVSGAHFNPAVTLGMWSSRRIKTMQGLTYVAAQFAGAAVAWWLYTYLANQSLPSTAQAFAWRIMVAEGIAGFIIAFGYAAAAYQKWEGFAYAACIGGAIFLGMLVASLASNGIGNPAIALGVHDWSWAYVAGPFIGGIIGVNTYLYVFAPESALDRVIARATAGRGTKAVAKKKPASRKRK